MPLGDGGPVALFLKSWGVAFYRGIYSQKTPRLVAVEIDPADVGSEAEDLADPNYRSPASDSDESAE